MNHMAWVTHGKTPLGNCPLDARCICELCWDELKQLGQPPPAHGTKRSSQRMLCWNVLLTRVGLLFCSAVEVSGHAFSYALIPLMSFMHSQVTVADSFDTLSIPVVTLQAMQEGSQPRQHHFMHTRISTGTLWLAPEQNHLP